jgi:hypothetical protein
MAFNVNEFRSHLNTKNGPARSANFEVNIALPPAVGDASKIRALTLQCEATDLPGKTYITNDAKVYGPLFKIPYQVQYDTISFTFVSTNDFSEKKIFDDWMNLIMSPSTYNLRFPKDSGYMTNAYVTQFDDAGTKIYRVQLIDAFPIGMSSMNMAWANDGFHRLTVQFTYHKYSAIDV